MLTKLLHDNYNNNEKIIKNTTKDHHINIAKHIKKCELYKTWAKDNKLFCNIDSITIFLYLDFKLYMKKISYIEIFIVEIYWLNQIKNGK